jgi:hypothetical protein
MIYQNEWREKDKASQGLGINIDWDILSSSINGFWPTKSPFHHPSHQLSNWTITLKLEKNIRQNIKAY